MADEPDPAPRRLLGPFFWLMILLSALCVAGGAAVALLGPRLAPAPACGSRSQPCASPLGERAQSR